MQVRKKFLRRALSLLLAIVCIVGTCCVDASAACTTSKGTMVAGWYCLSNANSDEWATYGTYFNCAGKTMTGIPTHAMKINGKWVQAHCMDSERGSMATSNYGYYDNFKCIDIIAGMTPNQLATLGAIMYKAETMGGITVGSDGIIPKRGGSTQTDHYLIIHLLCWGVRHNLVFLQGNGKIGVNQKAWDDLNWVCNAIASHHRKADGQALKGWVDKFVQNLTWCYSIPDFAVYTSTHPLGATVAGKTGNGKGDGWITLDKTCKKPDGTYEKTIIDNSGVLNGFDFTGQFSPGFSGLTIEQSGNKITFKYDGSTGCWEDESDEVIRKLNFGGGSCLFWDCGSPSDQRFVTYTPSTSNLGCKIKVRIKDCNETPPVDLVTTPPGTEVTPPEETPDVEETPDIEETPTPEPTPTPAPPEVYIRKTSDDGNVAGITFTITGGGETYHKITDETGFIDVSDLSQYTEDGSQLIEYHVEEEIPVEYIHDKDNASKNFLLEPGKTVYLDFENKRKVWRLTFKKHDSALATQAQGKGSLAGAEFGVYKDNVLLDTYTTDDNGEITTNYYPCDSGYTLIELSPPPGYMSDATVYAIGLLPSETLEQFNQCNRLEPLDGDDPEVIRRAYSIQSALQYKAESEMYEHLN